MTTSLYLEFQISNDIFQIANLQLRPHFHTGLDRGDVRAAQATSRFVRLNLVDHECPQEISGPINP